MQTHESYESAEVLTGSLISSEEQRPDQPRPLDGATTRSAYDVTSWSQRGECAKNNTQKLATGAYSSCGPNAQEEGRRSPMRKPRGPMRTAQGELEKKKTDDEMTGKEGPLRDRTDQQLVKEQCPQQAGRNAQEDWLRQSDVTRISTPTS